MASYPSLQAWVNWTVGLVVLRNIILSILFKLYSFQWSTIEIKLYKNLTGGDL